jgi:GNAT superfamily N-acetyltransferase
VKADPSRVEGTGQGLRHKSDAARVRILRLSSSDYEILKQVFDEMSSHSRYMRYHVSSPSLPSGLRRLVASLDDCKTSAMAAFACTPGGWRAVGIVWLVATSSTRADIAVEVVDSWHRHGIGTRLVREATQRACVLGLEELRAEVLSTNRVALRLLRRACPGVVIRVNGPEAEARWSPMASDSEPAA